MAKNSEVVMQPKYGVQIDPVVQPKYGVQIDPIVQPKYGVQIDPIVQPKYGVPIDPIVQPKYGVQIEPIVQPKYGVPYTDIDITYSQIEQNIATLKKTISSLKNTWETESKNNIARLQNSWVGADCKAYTDKLTKMDSKVDNTISALELLCSTYEQARDMLKDTQSKSMSAISNME